MLLPTHTQCTHSCRHTHREWWRWIIFVMGISEYWCLPIVQSALITSAWILHCNGIILCHRVCVCMCVCFLTVEKLQVKCLRHLSVFEERRTSGGKKEGEGGEERRWRKLIDFQMVNDEIMEWKGEREKESSDGPVGKIKSQDSCWSRQRRRETLQKKKRKIQKEKRAWSSIVSRLSLTPK